MSSPGRPALSSRIPTAQPLMHMASAPADMDRVDICDSLEWEKPQASPWVDHRPGPPPAQRRIRALVGVTPRRAVCAHTRGPRGGRTLNHSPRRVAHVGCTSQQRTQALSHHHFFPVTCQFLHQFTLSHTAVKSHNRSYFWNGRPPSRPGAPCWPSSGHGCHVQSEPAGDLSVSPFCKPHLPFNEK